MEASAKHTEEAPEIEEAGKDDFSKNYHRVY